LAEFQIFLSSMLNQKQLMMSTRLVKFVSLSIFLFFAATTTNAEAITAEQLYKELHTSFNNFKEKYDGKTIQVTGKIKYVTVSFGEVYVSLTNDGYNTPVELIFADEPQTRRLAVGSTITANGTVSRLFAGALGKAQLKPCTLVGTADAAPQASKPSANAPRDLPMGKYSVYQGGGFQYQYSLTLYANGTYKQYDKDMGKYTYNSSTKVIRFTSGPIEGFVGLYYTKGRNNDKNEPMIAIDFDGKVPDISNASNGQYQYAIFQKP
jgi:hypothetical protein